MAESATNWCDLVRHHWRNSERAAVVTASETWSGDELLRRAGGASRWFDSLGFAAGDVIPALVDESPAAIALTVGAAMSGRAFAPLGTRLPASDLAEALKNLGSRQLLTDPGLRPLAEEVARLSGVKLHAVEGPPEPAAILEAPWGPEVVVAVVHTSGTTGLPKPVFIRHRPLVARVALYAQLMPMGPGDLYYSASPYYHTAGISMTLSILGGGGALFPQPWFTVDDWPDVARAGVTHALLVPTMIDMLLSRDLFRGVDLRLLQYGAAPIHPETLATTLAALPNTRFLQIFGQTEFSPICVFSHEAHLEALADRPELLATVGKAAPGVTIRIENPDDDGVGEITARGAHAFSIDDDGWRRTGDLGRFDDEGYLTLHGRLNDRIVRGGENIYPVEVEQALATHPQVFEAAVVGVPDRRYGEIVKALVVPRDPAVIPSVEELRAHVRDRIAHFKVPTIVEFARELPRNPSGKVLRTRIPR